ncbi:MAG TPA: EamA family transporter [Chitinophagaceae bacterium]|nr:EamA family transporter [Chitinophagaceae bacterium]
MESNPGIKPARSLVIAAFAAIFLIWGSTYTAIAVALRTIPPFIIGGIRFLGAGILLSGWCLLRGERLPDLRSMARNAVAGILMLFCGTTSLIWAEQYLPSGLCAIIVAAIPLWFVILDKRQWKENLSSRLTILGLFIGFGGIILLSGGRGTVNLLHNHLQLVSFIVLLSGGVLWVWGSLFSKYVPIQGTTAMKASLQMVAAGIAGFGAALLTGEYRKFNWRGVNDPSLYALLYLIFMGSLVGYIAYIWLLSVRPAALVGTYAYVNPAVAVLLGWAVIGESVSAIQIAALIIIVGGVMLVNMSKYLKTKLSVIKKP